MTLHIYGWPIPDSTDDRDAYAKILAIADSKDKIPYASRIGGRTGDEGANAYYNFWQDADHLRGIWRRTSLGCARHLFS